METIRPVSGSKNQQPAQDSAYSEKLIRQYAELIENRPGEIVSDIKLLPAPKEIMKAYLLLAAKLAGPGERREWLKTGYMMLSTFQVMSDAERKALSSWNAVLGLVNLETQSARVKRAVMSDVADSGELAIQVYDRMSSESQLLLSDLRSAGV